MPSTSNRSSVSNPGVADRSSRKSAGPLTTTSRAESATETKDQQRRSILIFICQRAAHPAVFPARFRNECWWVPTVGSTSSSPEGLYWARKEIRLCSDGLHCRTDTGEEAENGGKLSWRASRIFPFALPSRPNSGDCLGLGN